METRVCKKCGEVLPLNDGYFYTRKDFVKGTVYTYFRKECINCIIKDRKTEYAASDKIKNRAKKYRDLPQNREKRRLHAVEYNKRQEVHNRQKEYRGKNRKKIRLQEKLWREKNPEKAADISRRKREKIKSNPIKRMNIAVHAAIRLSLIKRKKYSAFINMKIMSASDKVYKSLGYTSEDLRKHLESQFEPWMKWENYGRFDPSTWVDTNNATWKWNIDHKIPKSEFVYESIDDDGFKECWALSNLRPLSARTNTLDGAYKVRHKKKI